MKEAVGRRFVDTCHFFIEVLDSARDASILVYYPTGNVNFFRDKKVFALQWDVSNWRGQSGPMLAGADRKRDCEAWGLNFDS